MPKKQLKRDTLLQQIENKIINKNVRSVTFLFSDGSRMFTTIRERFVIDRKGRTRRAEDIETDLLALTADYGAKCIIL